MYAAWRKPRHLPPAPSQRTCRAHAQCTRSHAPRVTAAVAACLVAIEPVVLRTSTSACATTNAPMAAPFDRAAVAASKQGAARRK